MVDIDGGGGGRLAMSQWYQRSWSGGVGGGEEGVSSFNRYYLLRRS
jgi:hypothetical protein